MNRNKPLGQLTVPQLRQLISYLTPLEALKASLFHALGEEPEQLNEILTPDFSWATFYEYPYEKHLRMATTIMGLEGIFQVASFSDDPQQFILDRLDDDLEGWNGGADGQFELKHFFCAVISVMKSLECVMVHGRCLNDLVCDVRVGDDRSLFDAVRIDRSITSAPTIADRIARAEIDGDEKFFKKLKRALNGKTHKQWEIYNHLRFALHAMSDSGVNPSELSDRELEHLFIRVLKLYPDRSTDSIRGLRNFVNAERKKSRI